MCMSGNFLQSLAGCISESAKYIYTKSMYENDFEKIKALKGKVKWNFITILKIIPIYYLMYLTIKLFVKIECKI